MCDTIRRRLIDLDYTEDEAEDEVLKQHEDAYDRARDLEQETTPKENVK